jgi:hypothetical protein
LPRERPCFAFALGNQREPFLHLLGKPPLFGITVIPTRRLDGAVAIEKRPILRAHIVKPAPILRPNQLEEPPFVRCGGHSPLGDAHQPIG